ncbi:hypothetical protein [Dactylosporangium sp. CA-139066]|uniref:hypothetical protein n=1 Tax=Dactylosporangium sp. CA-139066 TaxID=3239930 RepID=UPI003D93309E
MLDLDLTNTPTTAGSSRRRLRLRDDTLDVPILTALVPPLYSSTVSAPSEVTSLIRTLLAAGVVAGHPERSRRQTSSRSS